MFVELTLLGSVVLGASCGLRVFLAPFVLCLLAVLGGPAADLPGWIGSPVTAAVVLVFLLIELGGDKVVGVDQALDAAGLVLRPLWAVGIVVATVSSFTVPAAAVAGIAALGIGLGKARLRTEAREEYRGNVVSPVVSLVEDLVAGVLVLAAVWMAPLGAVGIVAVGVGLHVAARVLHRRRWQALTAAA